MSEVTSRASVELRVCVVMPTYNNRRTVGRMVEQVLEVLPDLLVVDDGSTDGAAELLAGLEGFELLTLPENSGKGKALARGFERARELGYTHAITMDADGQHLASDLPAFLEEVRSHPDHIIVGERDLGWSKQEGRRGKSFLLRGHSNFWVWVETGRWVADTQAGFRAYPLAALDRLALGTRRYDFEIEVLVKAIWAGARVSSVPVRAEYGPGSESHFRLLHDSVLVSLLNLRLVVLRVLLPMPLLAAMHQRSFQDLPWHRRLWGLARGAVLQMSDTPARFGACIGLGVFFGILPIWGFQIAAAMVAAHWLRLSKPLVLAASNISMPPATPFILYLSLLLGRVLLHRRLDTSLPVEGLSLELLRDLVPEYLLGAVALALVAGLAAGLLAGLLARLYVLRPRGSRS